MAKGKSQNPADAFRKSSLVYEIKRIALTEDRLDRKGSAQKGEKQGGFTSFFLMQLRCLTPK